MIVCFIMGGFLNFMKSLIKKVLYRGGGFRICSLRKSSGFIPILMYHGIRLEQDNEPLKKKFGKHLDSSMFTEHLEILKNYCNPISLSEAFFDKKIPKNPIILTFDDGYKNNYEVVFPLLKKYQVPATIFVTTGFVDQTHFLWTDHLEFMFTQSECADTICLQGGTLVLRMGNEKEKRETLYLVKEKLKNYKDEDRLELLKDIELKLGANYEWDQIPQELMPLSWDEIREMKNSGLVEIGSHTVTHPILSKCSCEKQFYELSTSKNRIFDELGDDCTIFAYPNGRHIDYTQDTIRILKECGYKIALTTVPGYYDTSKEDSFEVKRLGRVGSSLEDFACIVSGFNYLIKKL